MISKKLAPFGTTIFSEMTALAIQHDAINLSQGFPDFEGPQMILDAAIEALKSGDNQYARSMGHPLLVEAISRHQNKFYNLSFDPMTEITVFSGATEGLASTLMGILNPGDEVILFEPFYDSYPACAALAGAIPRFATLRFPDFSINMDHLASLFNAKTKLLLLNTPHNPTGKVFTEPELKAIAELCIRHDVIVVTDEVYEHLTFDHHKHLPMAAIPQMRDRTISISSAGKTFSFTGWKVGWACGPKDLIAAAQAAHQFVTFATATPLQRAVAYALDNLGSDFYTDLKKDYQKKRDFLIDLLLDTGFKPATPQGTYFVLADFSKIASCDDKTFVKDLIKNNGVAAIPPSVFYKADPEAAASLVRFAFCKKADTLNAAADRLRSL